MIKEHKTCRVCGSKKLEPYFNLGPMPMSNKLLKDFYDYTPLFPLVVALCEDCGLSQLTIVVDPSELFKHYVYRSGISDGYKLHCADMARSYNLGPYAFHIDIAGNDGTLLEEFRKVHCYAGPVLNVDPAKNMEELNKNKGIRFYNTFWGLKAAEHLDAVGWPDADIITATNVLAHVDDVHDFMAGVKMALAPHGKFIVEFPYIVDFIDKKEFDTVYFEHLSYFSVRPLKKLCEVHGLEIVAIDHFDIHGGSIRCEIMHKNAATPTASVQKFLFMEFIKGLNNIGKYMTWAYDVKQTAAKFARFIKNLKGTIYGFGASAKGNILLNYTDIDARHIPFIIDQTPEKIGLYTPGVSIKIVDMSMLINRQPDYLVLLSWNFGEEIIDKCRAAGYKGKFIYPLTLEIV